MSVEYIYMLILGSRKMFLLSIDNSKISSLHISICQTQFKVQISMWDNLYLFNVSQFQDKEKCSCWQLTIQTTAASNPDAQVNANAGYEFRRLMEGVPTGIYECNKFCKCNNTCLNRVAQNPIRIPLQVFKTDRRGWGIRTLCDIPRGENLVIFEREKA